MSTPRPGTFLRETETSQTYLVLKQNHLFNLFGGNVVNLFTGELKHISNIENYDIINGWEIQW